MPVQTEINAEYSQQRRDTEYHENLSSYPTRRGTACRARTRAESSYGTIQDLFKTRFRLGGRNDHFHDQSDSCDESHRMCRESESNRMLVCSVLCYEHLVWNKRLNQFWQGFKKITLTACKAVLKCQRMCYSKILPTRSWREPKITRTNDAISVWENRGC